MLRTAARTVTIASAAGSVALTFYVGRHSAAPIVVILIAIWVLAPFIAFLLAEQVSMGWPALTRAALQVAMLVVSLASLAIYGIRVLSTSSTQAFVFVIVPPVSCVLTAAAVVLAALLSGRMVPGRPGQ